MDDIERLIANLEHMPDNMTDAIERQMRVEVKRIQADAKRLAPVDEGHLREMITADVERDADEDIVGTVGTNVEYALIKEFGSGPVGEASPKMLPENYKPTYAKSRTVSYVTKKGKKVKYTIKGWTYMDKKTGKYVYTEGQPATPFLYPALKMNERTAAENIVKAAVRSMKGDSDG